MPNAVMLVEPAGLVNTGDGAETERSMRRLLIDHFQRRVQGKLDPTRLVPAAVLLALSGAEIYFAIDAFNESSEAARSTAMAICNRRLTATASSIITTSTVPTNASPSWYEYQIDSQNYQDNRYRVV